MGKTLPTKPGWYAVHTSTKVFHAQLVQGFRASKDTARFRSEEFERAIKGSNLEDSLEKLWIWQIPRSTITNEFLAYPLDPDEKVYMVGVAHDWFEILSTIKPTYLGPFYGSEPTSQSITR